MANNPFPNVSSWVGRCVGHEDARELDTVKVVLGRLGVNQRGWRLLLSFGESLYGPLEGSLIDHRRPLASLENLAFYLRLLQQCEMDVLPQPEFARAWGRMNYPDEGGCGLQDVPVGLFRAAWQECVRRQYVAGPANSFLSTELPQVVWWFFRTERHRIYTPQHSKAGWVWFSARYDGWLRRCRHSFDRLREWEPLLGKGWIVQGVLAVELTSGEAIKEEGDVMRHCVATCIDACREGVYRVFSLREPDTGERIATLGVMRDECDGEWFTEDLRAEDNADPDDALIDVAADVLNLCNESERYQPTVPAVRARAAERTQRPLFDEEPVPLP